jgi:hypothetical protein
MFTAFLALPFFFAGIIAFITCVAIHPLRRYALSSALWFVSLVPGLLVGLILAGLWNAVIGHVSVSHSLWQEPLAHLPKANSGSMLFNIAIATPAFAIATFVALLHQTVIHRVTLMLFRLYVTGVGFGIGLLSTLLLIVGSALARIRVPHPGPLFLILAILLATATAYLCFRNAPSLRGTIPRRFPIVTEEEFGTTS